MMLMERGNDYVRRKRAAVLQLRLTRDLDNLSSATIVFEMMH